MQSELAVLLFTTVVFLAVMMNLAVKSARSDAVTGIAAITALAGGLVVYSFAYAATEPVLPLAILRAVLAVCGMFMGKNEYTVSGAEEIFGGSVGRAFFWFFHLCAVYATASAAIKTIGERALRSVRLLLIKRGTLNIIYGVRPDTVAFGQRLAGEGKNAVVFIDENPEPGCIQTIEDTGFILRTDRSASEPGEAFLKSIGLTGGNRKVVLWAVHQSGAMNLRYARMLMSAMEKTGISPERTRLLLFSQEQEHGDVLQASKNHYGYGSVTIISEPELAARLMIRTALPAGTIRFGPDGKALEDFEAVIIGFGQAGQAALKSLIMNGQFEGSHFHITVFDPDFERVAGRIFSDYAELFQVYDITFRKSDGRSREFYEYLRDNAGRVRYLVVSAGSSHVNSDISEEIRRFFEHRRHRPVLMECSRSGIRQIEMGDDPDRVLSIYTPDILDLSAPDRGAIRLNAYYCGENGKTADENWADCDYFSRMSSRASADFMPAHIRAAGRSESEVLAGEWDLTDEQKENLARTEHLRWCAFNYCMGYFPMSREEWEARADIYRKEKAEKGVSRFRISKDTENHLHACLVPWEDLDGLSARENAVTGGNVDYKKADVVNIMALPGIIAAIRQSQ